MVKYFLGQSVLRSSWDRVFTSFWQRYPNPYSKHVLREDLVHREVTPDRKLRSWSLPTNTNRMPRWAERRFPANVAHSVYILHDSIVDPQNQTMTAFTWNIHHARLMVVEERCVYCVNDSSGEAWVSSILFAVRSSVLPGRFKSNGTKTMKGFEYILAKLQAEPPSRTFVETAKEAKEKAKEMALAATEKAKDLAKQCRQQAAAAAAVCLMVQPRPPHNSRLKINFNKQIR
ncbi:PRELI domain-containing protein 1, mitochondrial-like [Perognathus longimembris pacificus]|uniref:PRELI domain-containing protein 1, mitochondrial-like n=1 Tax=Perognathus longimembris pacificus TaxID=214514 RepID=UPI002019D148|nr:PRELI domain-containing protein 1, mitochondrial-like [Perognathus longimembris pacificus]